MNNNNGSKNSPWALIIAVPVMIACCAAPLLVFPMLAGLGSWFTGANVLTAIVVSLAVALIVFQVVRSRRAIRHDKPGENRSEFEIHDR